MSLRLLFATTNEKKYRMLLHQGILQQFYSRGYPGALIWDMDGVLANTMSLHFQALQEACEAENLFFPENIINWGTGRTDRENLSSILRSNQQMWNEDKIQMLLSKKAARYQEMVKGGLQTTPGVHKWLTDARSLSIPCAVASSATLQVISESLENLHIAHFFSALISGHSLPQSKPSPEIFLRAAQALAKRPAECLVIEDAPVGIMAAHSAGMRCIAIGTSFRLDELSEGDIVVKDLTEVSLV